MSQTDDKKTGVPEMPNHPQMPKLSKEDRERILASKQIHEKALSGNQIVKK
jgi:hypothetical protein